MSRLLSREEYLQAVIKHMSSENSLMLLRLQPFADVVVYETSDSIERMQEAGENLSAGNKPPFKDSPYSKLSLVE
jgi:hypothetical protein